MLWTFLANLGVVLTEWAQRRQPDRPVCEWKRQRWSVK